MLERPGAIMFIQTEATPNPATLKFLPGKVVLAEGTADFRESEAAAAASPLARKLFAIPGVTGVFFGYDFVTVSKDDGPEWQHLKPAILGAIMEHFMSGEPVMASGSRETADSAEVAGEFYDEADREIVVTIKELLETRVRPAVAQDGGDITFRGYENGVVYLNMKGACSGCPSSTATLKHGIQNLLRHFVPEVQQVEQVAG
jgi:Fe-S cluster biogenesis protein NfuA